MSAAIRTDDGSEPHPQESVRAVEEGLHQPVEVSRTAVSLDFDAHARAWRAGIAYESSTTAIFSHPSFEALVAMGRPVVPLMLRELAGPDPLFWGEALGRILHDGPTLMEADRGRPARIAAAWLAWANAHGLAG